MKRFIKYYALEIYTVLALSFIVATAVIGNLSTVQKLVVVMHCCSSCMNGRRGIILVGSSN